MRRDEFQSFLDWWAENEAEYRALSYAEDGNPVPLAELIRSVGNLATQEARAFVADRLEGKKKRRGLKRTIAQQAKEVGILGIVRSIQDELGCSEHRAMSVFLDRHPDECSDLDTLKTYVRRAKATLKEAFGREPPSKVQKSANTEPERP